LHLAIIDYPPVHPNLQTVEQIIALVVTFSDNLSLEPDISKKAGDRGSVLKDH